MVTFEVKIEERASQPTVTVRTQTSIEGAPAFFELAFGKVSAYISEAGQQPTGPAFALLHTLDPSSLDLEAGFPVAAPIAGDGDVEASEIPGGKVCTTLLVGPYERLPEAWEALWKYATEQGLEADTWGYEVFITDPTTVEPEEIQTQVVLPLVQETEATVCSE